MPSYPRLFLLLGGMVAAQVLHAAAPSASVWPEIQRTNKPWVRWWWPGSGVDQAGITRELEELARAGVGGVEITPIYGARGYENRYIDFLSPRWMEVLEFTGREAQRLGLGVDMATGTGWPFGGPWITEADGSKKIALQDGKLAGVPTGMKVKRAAPGDEGLVIDPYSVEALQHYLAPFSKAFAAFPRGLVRSQFHDSFEYYGAEWSPKLPEVFQAMHGYDIQQFAAELTGAKPLDADTLGRIKSDYREVLARLHFDYLSEWARWSHEHGFLVRNQSHGAPANLLDLYGAVDIPETETFGSTPFPIPGLRRELADVRQGQDLPEPLVIRLASSAAHVMGHPLASSETCTWLREHWKEALSFTKPEIDRLFAAGINHILYHGTAYSPPDAPWPGWLFYASTEFNPRNPWWDDFGALNAYVARVQSILQSGQPDNDVLLYWPFADAIDDSGGALMKQFAVHDVKWLVDSPMGRIAKALIGHGYSYDYISDAQLLHTTVKDGELAVPGGNYRALVIPATRRMPVETLEQLLKLKRAGANIIFEALPEDVPGYGRLAERRAQFKTLRDSPELAAAVNADLSAALEKSGASREPAAETGLSFIRRANGADHDYFFANLTAKPFDGWLTLGTQTHTATLLDPLSGRAGLAAVRPGRGGASQVYLQLVPGESLLLRALGSSSAPVVRDAWKYMKSGGAGVPLAGKWSIEFTKGGPELPPALTTSELKSWTDLGGDEAKRFAGTARYRLEFDLPAQAADDWLLDLGDVRDSARVRVNGTEVATVWSVPFRVRIGAQLKPGRNILELDVTNLAANRIRDMDKRGVQWKIMREINFVNINYKPFDASQWALTPSGLLGPVTLVPLQKLSPQ